MNKLQVLKIREQLNLTQTELAEKLGVSLRTVQNWEAGKKIPSTKHEILHNLLSQIDSEDCSEELNAMKQRIKILISWLISEGFAVNQEDLGKKIGIESKSYLSQLINGTKNNDKLVNKLISLDKRISEDWLLTGEGEMLKREEKEEVIKKEDEALYYVPLLPISAQGGSLNDYVESIRESECERIPSPIKGADWAIQVDGDSMFPKHPNGSVVLIKKVYETAFIQWGESFVLDTCNGVVVKRLYPSEHKGCIKCVSINPDFPPFEVAGESIYGVYKVVMTMSKN